MKAGKPQDQSLAIAYSIKKHSKKKMARGGEVRATEDNARDMREFADDKHQHMEDLHHEDDFQTEHMDTINMQKRPEDMRMEHKKALAHKNEDEIEAHRGSIADDIMRSRRMQNAQTMSEGGMVDIDENEEEEPNQYYRANEEALKENYDSDMDDMHQPEDSNEHGDHLADEDKMNMVDHIRAKLRLKRGI